MLSEKSPTRKLNKNFRVPDEVDGIQVNFCKNPHCKNFQVPVRQGIRRSGRSKDNDPNYTLSTDGSSETGILRYVCKSCKAKFAAKSNIGVAAEFKRISEYLKTPEPSCKDPACANHLKGIYSHPNAYRKYGVTDTGSMRYQCKAPGCGKTFSIREKPVRRQVNPHLNIMTFKLLMNKVPLKRILEITDLDKKTL